MFFGGKGGVGKTTCASAYALAASRSTLAVSTDPAHSLGDALARRLSSRPTRVAPRVDAVELDAPRAFRRWVREHHAALGEILEHGTWLDRGDVDAMLELSIPGVDELMGLIEIHRLASSAYELIVVDTAPTGHTLRLMAAPDAVRAVADVLDALQEEHRTIRRQLARVSRPEASDRLIELLVRQAAEIAAELRDGGRTAFHWVTLPEELALAESEDAIRALERGGVRVAEIVINRVLPAARTACPVCDRRRAGEHAVVARIVRALGRGRRIRIVPAQLREPSGPKALAKIGKALGSAVKVPSTKYQVRRRDVLRTSDFRLQTSDFRLSVPAAAAKTPPEEIDAIRGAELLFFGGKGGVGKTTVAAASAVRLARANPRRRVLLMSTDPAHSLADVFDAPAGDEPAIVRGGPRNLLVREVDAPAALAARRGDLQAALDEIAAALGTSTPSAAGDLMDLAPPGIDELFGMLSILDAREKFDTIVVDTAPTGHALRLLETPQAAREWVQVLLRVLLKYRSVVKAGGLAAELVDLSKSIRELQALLRDRRRTRFLVVTRAADVPMLETMRLVERLRRLELRTPAVVVNAMTLAPGRCPRCRATAAAERRAIRPLGRRSAKRADGCVIIRTPIAAPPPRGARRLGEWAAQWLTAER